jgi:hypothetical protein
MSVIGRVKKLSPFAAIAIAAGIGCSADRDVWMTQVGDYLFEFPVDASPRAGTPAGTNEVTGYSIAAIDLTMGEDPLNRITRPGRSAGFTTTGAAGFTGWNYANWDRNASNDPRLPALTSTTARIVPSAANAGMTVITPGSCCGGVPRHSPRTFGQVQGLLAGGVYTVAFYRMALDVRGMLDAAQVALGQPVTEPDSLYPLGGTPGGYPATDIGGAFPPPVNPVPNANPFVLGFFTADAGGNSAANRPGITIEAATVPDSVRVLWQGGTPTTATAAQFDSALVARNDNVATTFPRYNYMVFHLGTAATAAEVAALPQVLRIQIGTDLDASGQPILNAYAPFPTSPSTVAQLLAGTGVASKVADAEATLHNLVHLQGMTYQAWLVNTITGEYFSPVGDWVATVTDEEGQDSVVAEVQGARTFNPMADWTVTFRTSDDIAGQPIGDYTHLMFSIEQAEAQTPSAMQPLWVRQTDMMGDPGNPFAWEIPETASLRFGTFKMGDTVPFVARGTGRGHFWGTTDDDEFRVRFRDLDRPPVGYFYEGWMFPEAGHGAPFSLGPITAPLEDNHVSLRDADVNAEISQFVRSDRILDALQLVRIGDFVNNIKPWHISEYRLMLSPKMAAERPVFTVLGGDIPDAVQGREPAQPAQ